MKILNKSFNGFIIKFSVKIFTVEIALGFRVTGEIYEYLYHRTVNFDRQKLAIANWLEKSIWRLPRYPKYRALLSAGFIQRDLNVGKNLK